MVSSGRISLLIDSPLRTLAQVLRGVDGEIRKQIGVHTKAKALPIWEDTVKANVVDRMQTRVLGDSARVGVTATNVFLRSGGVGTLSSGTPVSVIAKAVEFGADPNAKVASRTKGGKSYTRRRGGQFKRPRAQGYVVHPAARESIPRIASLWVQTAVRTIHEAFEKGTR
jgi:hypothetical protein